MSEQATLISSLNTYLPTIGLQSLDEELTDINTKQSIVKWIRKGAHDEDDTISANFARYRNHFYDPQHGGQGYTFGTLTGAPSPDWGLEDTRIFATQSYSFKDARQYYYDALTLTNGDNRQMWMARTFYTLGHSIHLIEDMAQPQHTRNDSHGGRPLGPPSLYEKYTDLDKVRGNLPFSDANYNQNSPVIFDKARSFWTTGDGQGLSQFSSDNFLSTGTNFRGAFQDGGLVAQPNERYPLPAPGAAKYEDANSLLTSIGTIPPAECAPPHNPCVMAFFNSEVTDNYRPSAGGINPKASTASIFDQDLELYRKTVSYPNLDKCADPTNPDSCERIETGQIFALNRFNFDQAHKFLIPKAVAYSAGLIDYFFRGKLAAEDAVFTDTGISLRVRNAIDPQKTPAWANEVLYPAGGPQPGTLTIAYEYKDAAGENKYGASQAVPMAAEPGSTGGIAPGETSQNVYDFALSLPAGAMQVKYRLVFQGRLGQEDGAVAVGQVEPISGFVVTPNYAPTDGISGPRAIFNQGGQWRLSDKKGPAAGNIDWKGWYVNGKPTKVLSWKGPSTRYFPDPLPLQHLDSVVYQDGKYATGAPGPVLGAALAKDTAGREWLVVVTLSESDDVVYRRPNDHSDTADDWEEIGRASAAQLNPEPGATFSVADIPWFFSGDGHEAQTLRSWRGVQSPYTQLMRLKFEINADVTAALPSSPANLMGFETKRSCTGGYDNQHVGGANWNTQTTGEYIVAVDYKDDREVLARVRVEASTVGVTRAADKSGNTRLESQWREYFLWDGGQTMYYDEKKTITSSWTNLFTDFRESDAYSLYWRQFLYGLDLRNEAYAYTYWQSDKQNNISGTNQGYRIEETDTLTEGGSIDVAGDPRAMIYSQNQEPFVNIRTTYNYPATERLCPSLAPGGSYSDSWVAYGALDFSSPIGNGSFAVDTNENIAASFSYLNFNNELRHFNHLTGAALPQVLPGAPPDARYDPIGVIR